MKKKFKLINSPQSTTKRQETDNYSAVFIKPKRIRQRQCVYISQDIHADISRIVHLLAIGGTQISVGGFIDNILSEHMEKHKDIIADLCQKQLGKL